MIASIKEKTPSERLGIQLINQGTSLDVRRLRILRGRSVSPAGTSEPSATNPPNAIAPARLILRDGKTYEEAIQGLADGKLMVASSANEPISLPNVAQLDFPRTVLGKSQPTKSHCLRLQDGSEIWCDAVNIADGKVRVQASCFSNEVSFPTNRLLSIRFQDQRSAGHAQADTLQTGRVSLEGAMTWGNPERPLVWSSQGQLAPVAIGPSLPVHIAFADATDRIVSSQYPDIVYFKNGDVLPCMLESIREKGVTLQTSFCESRFIPSHLVRAIELRRSGERLKHSFTKESREQLLTIPRTTDASLCRHAILATNGDLLRGTILGLQGDQLEIESKLEPFLIPKDVIQGIVFLEEPAPLTPKESSSTGLSEAPSTTVVDETGDKREDPARLPDTTKAIQIGFNFMDSFSLAGSLVAHDEQSLELDTPSLGRCRIPRSSIVSVTQGGLDPSTPNQLYTSWKLQATIAPRWKAAENDAGEASALVGTRVADFELAGIDGKTFRFAEQAGKVVILDFWASWERPLRHGDS